MTRIITVRTSHSKGGKEKALCPTTYVGAWIRNESASSPPDAMDFCTNPFSVTRSPICYSAALPGDLCRELHDVVEHLDVNIALRVINRIRPQHAALAELVKQYGFDTQQTLFAERV